MGLAKKHILVLFLFLFSCLASAQPRPFPKLRHTTDPVLQQGLVRLLAAPELKADVRRHRIGVALVDITDPMHPRLAMVNGDTMIYAASLPKIAILLGAFERAARGQLKITPEVRSKLTEMIRYSSNAAATEMLDRVGKNFVAAVLESPRYRLYDPKYNGGLWVGKEYGSRPAFKRDPLHHLSHGATAFQVARYYYLLQTGRLVSPQASRQMKQILSDPQIHHNFVKGLMRAVPDARIYRKSGTWHQWHCDSAIVEHDGRRYIAVGLIEDPRGGEWLSKLIVKFDHLVYQTAPQHVARVDDTR
jgi:beta-lactamase class A